MKTHLHKVRKKNPLYAGKDGRHESCSYFGWKHLAHMAASKGQWLLTFQTSSHCNKTVEKHLKKCEEMYNDKKNIHTHISL